MKRFILFFAALSLIPLAGCGGGSQRETTGRLTVNVKWPEPSRLIPLASNSILIEIFDGPETDDNANRVALQTKTVTRPTTSAIFAGLPVANLFLRATAYPADPVANPGVIAQASGTTLIAVRPGNDPANAVTVTMNSTIDRIEVSPITMDVGAGPQTLTATARDSASSLVLVAPSVLEWDIVPAGIATVSNAGVVTPVSSGVAIVTVRDTESNKSGSAAVTVTTGGGTANVTVNNPPPGTRSLRIDVAGSIHDLPWTTGTTISDAFSGIPAGNHTATATAFSQNSASGTVLGTASGGITIPSLGSGSVTLNLISSVTSIALIPAGPTVLQGQNVTLSVQAFNGATPLATLASAAFNWTITPNPVGAASVNAGGVVSTTASGSAVVRATDPRTAAFAETTVNIGSSSGSAGGVVR